MAAYATAAQLRAQINKTSAADDAVLTLILQAASNVIDRVTNHHIDGVSAFDAGIASARVYNGSGRRYQWIDECVSISSVAVKDSVTDTTYTAWLASDWLAFTGGAQRPNYNDKPYTGLMCAPNGNYSVFTSGAYGGGWCDLWENVTPAAHLSDTITRPVTFPTVQVTASWGVTATPPNEISEAAIMIGARWWKRLESAMSDTLASGELGQLLYTQPVDPDIKFILMNSRWYRPQVARRY